MAIVITGDNGRVGIEAAVEVLRKGGPALDAVEAGIRHVELNAADHSVGLGGYPNILGDVELDAGIMDGRTRRVGSVAAVRGFVHPISIARQVMEKLPHVLLVGAGAERFADEVGAERSDRLNAEAQVAWRERLMGQVGVHPLEIATQHNLAELVWRALGLEGHGGTNDFIALDAEGNLAAGVTTSGLAWKYPGRVGDSPIAGAGYYADSRYGAAACTGAGELAIRASTARSAILYLQIGFDIELAGRATLRELYTLGEEGWGMSLLLLNAQGRAMGFATRDHDAIYWAMTPQMSRPEERERVIVGA
jgi:beta-aspartyl-peptidase (threonine type)